MSWQWPCMNLIYWSIKIGFCELRHFWRCSTSLTSWVSDEWKDAFGFAIFSYLLVLKTLKSSAKLQAGLPRMGGEHANYATVKWQPNDTKNSCLWVILNFSFSDFSFCDPLHLILYRSCSKDSGGTHTGIGNLRTSLRENWALFDGLFIL